MIKNKIKRCTWAGNDPLYQKYHDDEWGVPVHDDRKLFEMLILEGAQAGLSWITILRKRENYRKAFDNFDFNKVAKYDKKKINSLMKDAGIIRNKLKIESAEGWIKLDNFLSRDTFERFNKVDMGNGIQDAFRIYTAGCVSWTLPLIEY